MDDRTYMISEGWYLEYEGNWYRVAQFTPDVLNNTMSVHARSAETDLDAFLTNYGQVPFSMPSHMPSEIMDAVFSGTPLCGWYNGEFAQLDDSGFPVGWYKTLGAWTLSTDYGEHIVSTVATAATLSSEGLRHTSGAEIKPSFDIRAAEGFAGVVQAVVSWQNAGGVESSSQTLEVELTPGDWTTFTAPGWIAIRNERCVLSLQVQNNAAGLAVDFRRVCFLQNETPTDWQYIGSMDTRDPDVHFNDVLFQRYGGWIQDLQSEWVWSKTVGDDLARPFTGDLVTVIFGPGGTGSKCDILVDGVARVTNLDVSAACSYSVSDLNRFRSHMLEIVVKAGAVVVAGLTLSTENRIAVTWNRLGDYQALKALKDLVGGEFVFDTRNKTVFHDQTQGEDVTNLNLLWLREGVNLETFVPTIDQQAIQNRCYYGGYGDGAFQVGVVVDSDEVDADGLTSQQRFGIVRFPFTNKDTGDLAAAAYEALQKANENAFPKTSYKATMADGTASLLGPGDTVRVTHSAIGGTKSLRVLDISRSSEGQSATVSLGDRISSTNPASQYIALHRKVEQLLRAY